MTAACSDPAGPELTGIVVTLDWPLAREPGFVDARWQLIRYEPESPDLLLLGPRGSVVQSGVTDSTGTFVVHVVGPSPMQQHSADGRAPVQPPARGVQAAGELSFWYLTRKASANHHRDFHAHRAGSPPVPARERPPPAAAR